MDTQSLLDTVLADLKNKDTARAASWFDYPFFGLSNDTTLHVKSADGMQSTLDCILDTTDLLTVQHLEKTLVSEDDIGPGLKLAQCSTRLISPDKSRFTDARTEYIVVRQTDAGPRFAASLNLFGGHIDLSAFGTVVTNTSASTSPTELIQTYATAVRTADMSTLGQTLEFPSTAISGNKTRITPDFDQYMSFAVQLMELASGSGLSMSRVETGPLKAVGADLLLAPVTLHMSHQTHGPLKPYDQLLCLRIGMDSVSCAVVINAVDGALAQLSLHPIK